MPRIDPKPTAEPELPSVPSSEGMLIGRSDSHRRLLQKVARVARTPRTTVLVRGEAGTEKTSVARAIHDASSGSGPFVTTSCVRASGRDFAIEPWGGRESGAPLLVAATSGTLYLDEVGSLSPEGQSALLRVLQDQAWHPAAGHGDLPIGARIVASTGHDLERMAEEGTFREDLLYRLNVLSVQIPPLRERLEDVPLLARHFLADACAELGRHTAVLSDGAAERLCSHPWPGNVQELRLVIQRAALLAGGGPILPQDVDPGPGHPFPGACGARERTLELDDLSLRAVEKQVIRLVLCECGGNRSRASKLLGINRTTLYNKLRQYGIR